jgi:pimeloyl-ACP methyl ester carboxylesterase
MKGVPAVALFALALLRAVAPAPRPTPATASLDMAASRFASYGGYRVHYKSLGSGRQGIVFVHGLACDLTSWRFQVPALARARLVLLDLPGHGQSDKPERLEYSMRFHALALETVLREAGVDRAVLVGHSMGTPIVREFYRMYPQRTAALVAVDGALRAMITEPAAIERFIAPYRGPDFLSRLEKFADSMLPAAGAPAWRDELRRTMLSTPKPVVVRSMEGMLDPAVWKEDPVGVPLLSVVAKNPFWSAEYEAYVRALGPDVDYRVVEGAGHFLMLEKPDTFNAILSDFLTRRGLLGR